MRILTFFAHLDDAEIWAGGTIAKHVDGGHVVRTIAFSDAESPRVKESKQAHKLLGAELEVVSNLSPKSDFSEAIVLLKEQIQSFEPEVLITHWQYDSHPEHRAVFEIASNACVESRIESSYPRRLFSSDTYNSLGINGAFNATHYIDVSNFWDKKMEAISQFRSEPVDMWKEMIRKQNAVFGSRVRVEFAEGFLQMPMQGMMSTVEYLS